MSLNAMLADRNVLAKSQSLVDLVRAPLDCTECKFLGRFVNDLARVHFGDKWTGMERDAELLDTLPDAINPALGLLGDPQSAMDAPAQWFNTPNHSVLSRAHELLVRHRPDLRRTLQLPFFGVPAPKPLTFKYGEWLAAQDIAYRQHCEAWAAIKRWCEIKHLIVSLCEEGILKAKLRPVLGGKLSEVLSPDLWRTEFYHSRFITFKLDPDRPFTTDVSQVGTHWIFVTRTSADDAARKIRLRLAAASAAPADGTQPRYRSEYMQCMEDTVASLDITTENQPKKAEVEATLRSHWRGAAPLSSSDIQHMASFIRTVESRAGRNKQKR